MDRAQLRESNAIADLEIGGTPGQENKVECQQFGGKHPKKELGRLRSGFMICNCSIDGDDDLSSKGDELSTCDEKGKIKDIRKEGTTSIGDKLLKDKRKTRISNKPPKPPRPPRGPSLDAADMKLVREMSELAKLKHARIERMRALKKRRTDKASSSNSNVLAMVITILFFCIIIFQGNVELLARVTIQDFQPRCHVYSPFDIC
ncbi:hypothetical protein K2173_027004 [Erythroxylum novogranatense]|uniref:Transmembrane protein n=1 Tax=Erythroxylum novogranatense TaxID=1862640 RepID=A0AAV8TY17_9ROSI|nr:hypothetical protein K2173_027004 [Erythroxylum novogranatense]